MTKRPNTLIAVCAVLTLASVLHATLRAQGAKSVADGIYTEAQAKRGMDLFGVKCKECHGEDLKGMADIVPALTGDSFMMNWKGKQLNELFDKIYSTMPALDPGSLKPDQAADLIAYIFSVSKYPAGTEEIAPNSKALTGIKIDAPK